jgi:hypothetical protein
VPTLTLDDLVEGWQKWPRTPGELVGVWNHELAREDIGLVVKEEKLRKKFDYNKVHVLIGGRIEMLSKCDIFPVGRARQTIPF